MDSIRCVGMDVPGPVRQGTGWSYFRSIYGEMFKCMEVIFGFYRSLSSKEVISRSTESSGFHDIPFC